MQFSLECAKVRLVHKNERLEKHGEDDVLACDLDFEYETGNDVLAEFHPELRSVIYKKPDGVQGEVIDSPEHLTALRIPEMPNTVKFQGSMEKAAIALSKGKKKHVEFAEAKITKFALECKEGGTVVVHFQAQVRPDEEQSGKLSGLLQDKHCLLSLSPAEDPQRPLMSRTALNPKAAWPFPPLKESQ